MDNNQRRDKIMNDKEALKSLLESRAIMVDSLDTNNWDHYMLACKAIYNCDIAIKLIRCKIDLNSFKRDNKIKQLLSKKY